MKTRREIPNAVVFTLPYLAAIGFCFAIVGENPRDIPPLGTLAKAVGVALGIVALLHLLGFAVLRKFPARELILLQIVVFVGVYRPSKMFLLEIFGVPQPFFLAGWIVILVGLCLVTWRWADDPRLLKLASSLAVAVVVLVLFQTGRVMLSVVPDRFNVSQLQYEHLMPADSSPAVPPEALPDIYYVVLDAYGRQDVLSDVYGHDNTDFVEALRQRGFYVGDRSRSNYHLTELSLASSLNMAYLHDLPLEGFHTRIPLRRLICDSTVGKILKRHGYRTVAFESGKCDTECRAFDRYFAAPSGFNDYEDALFYLTPADDLVPFRLFGWSPAAMHRDRISYTFRMLPQATGGADSPSLVLAHLLTPHPPFVFDADGSETEVYGLHLLADGDGFHRCNKWDRKLYTDSYRRQLTFINSQLLTMVDRIQSESSRPAVIILQADHGPRRSFSFSSPEESDLREAYGILNAIYIPPDVDVDFYDDMTPVNTFRLILDQYFRTKLGRVEDRSYYEYGPYEFEDITQDIDQSISTQNQGNP